MKKEQHRRKLLYMYWTNDIEPRLSNLLDFSVKYSSEDFYCMMEQLVAEWMLE